MRRFKTKEFHRLCRKAHVTDVELRTAAKRAEEGKVDANLGSHLLKQHVSQGKGGQAGGHRAIIIFAHDRFMVFVHLFAKRDKANLTDKEKAVFKRVARAFVELDAEQVSLLLETKEWIEIPNEEEILQE
jgi:hypothetical protein